MTKKVEVALGEESQAEGAIATPYYAAGLQLVLWHQHVERFRELVTGGYVDLGTAFGHVADVSGNAGAAFFEDGSRRKINPPPCCRPAL
ncbi:MAG TPA: hypothetical protein VGN79_07680 [Devosia sp.]|nr:hypothetical protein [Devosia sp.]